MPRKQVITRNQDYKCDDVFQVEVEEWPHADQDSASESDSKAGAEQRGDASDPVTSAQAAKAPAKPRTTLLTGPWLKGKFGRAEEVLDFQSFSPKQKQTLKDRVLRVSRGYVTWMKKSRTLTTSFTESGMRGIAWSDRQVVRELIQNQLDALRELSRINMPKGEQQFLTV